MQFSQFDATVSYSPFGDLPSGERLHVGLKYKTLNWSVEYKHNGADFYDLFGPVERSRKGDAFIVGWNKTEVYDPPRQLDFFGTGGGLFRARAAALGAEHRQPEQRLLDRGRGQIYQHPQVAGRGRS